MKKVISFFSIITAMSFLLLMGCNSKDNKDEAITEVVTSDTTQYTLPDTTVMAGMDTSNKGAMTNTNTNTAAKTKKGKVSSIMMTNSDKSMPMNKDKSGYYSSVEVLPMFPGGQDGLNNFINSNLEYPESANENGIDGVVTVSFAVDESGKVSNPKIIGKPLGYGLEEEVIKAVNKMPVWTPGVIKGKNVKTYYTLPVNFKIEN